jgi:CDP-diacylglycerol---glycerol-3-phosphate 3-phosphatidyltransferase
MLSWRHGPFMNLPNSLTVTRIFLVPLLVVVLLTKFEGRQIFGIPNEIVGAAIFGLASLTDWADGYVARRRKQITPLGQMIDPLADKLLTLAALISLVQLDLAPAWMVAVLLGRDFAVTGLRSLAYSRGVAVPASPLGKIKMVAQVVAILALILAHGQMREFYLDRIGQTALWIAVIVSLASGADYFRRYNRILHPRVAPFPTARERGSASLKPQATSRSQSATNRKPA